MNKSRILISGNKALNLIEKQLVVCASDNLVNPPELIQLAKEVNQ